MVLTAQEAAAKPRPLEEAVFLARPPTLAAGAPRCIVSGSAVSSVPWVHVGCMHGARAGLPSPFARRYIPPAVPPPTRVAGEERQREGQLADNFQTVFDACASRLRRCDLCLATPTTQRLSRMPLAYTLVMPLASAPAVWWG